MRKMELDPLSDCQSSRGKALLSAADWEPMSGLECKLGGLDPQKCCQENDTYDILSNYKHCVLIHDHCASGRLTKS